MAGGNEPFQVFQAQVTANSKGKQCVRNRVSQGGVGEAEVGEVGALDHVGPNSGFYPQCDWRVTLESFEQGSDGS